MNKRLERSKTETKVIHISTKHPDGTSFDGIVLQTARSFVAFKEISSFEPDGIVVLPKRWVRSVRDGKYEQCANKILRLSGQLELMAKVDWPTGFTGLAEIVTHLRDTDLWPAIEVIYDGRASLYMGPITKVSKSSLELYCYDAAGKWEKSYEIDFDEIFKIEIDSRYTRHFNEYMRAVRKPRDLKV